MNMEMYHIRRNNLIKSIENFYNKKGCNNCCNDNLHQLQIHHVYFNGESYKLGGTKGLIRSEKDWLSFLYGNEEKRLKILCKECHINAHYYHLREKLNDD